MQVVLLREFRVSDHPLVISTERSEWRNLECVRISCVQGYGFVGVFSCTLLAESLQKEGFPGDVYKKSGF